jgi:hypothetical protein
VAVVVVVAGGLAGAGLAGAFRGPSSPAAGSGTDGTGTAPVTRQDLSAQTQVPATLQNAGDYTVVNQAAGTLTWLPAAGGIIRQGGVLYKVDGAPVVLLYGRVPAYRTLDEGMTGGDVRELNHDLVSLGYADAADIEALGWGYFGWDTKAGLEGLQSALGEATPTGTLPLGDAVFLPSAVKITSKAGTLGGPATPGSPVLAGSSTKPIVSIALDADQQTEVKVGNPVTVTLPDGATTPGKVSSVGRVATTSSSGTTTVPVDVALTRPAAAGKLDKASVTVSITTASVRNALVVPVDALLAQPGGGYAVEVAGPHGSRHLVTVSLGLTDDAAGLVQVTHTALAPGQRVVVPAL